MRDVNTLAICEQVTRFCQNFIFKVKMKKNKGTKKEGKKKRQYKKIEK